MTLEGYLEKLGGAPEPVLRPDVDLTCEEISDKGRLCHAPTVSVLMRVYRAAKFVGKALDGIFEQQTNFPFEVVVCDDCSPDDTVEVLRDYLQRFPEKMRILRAKVNKGYLFTHERCHAYARGAWIAECDADDIWTNPLKLQKQYELVKAYNAVFCVTAFRTVFVRTGAEYASFRPKGTVLTRRELAAAYYQTSPHFYSKQTYDKMVAENRDWSGDFDDMNRQEMLSAYGRVVFLPDVSSTYFVGEGNYSQLDAEKKRTIYLRDHLSALVFAKRRAVRSAMGLGLLDAIYRELAVMPRKSSKMLSAQRVRDNLWQWLGVFGHAYSRIGSPRFVWQKYYSAIANVDSFAGVFVNDSHLCQIGRTLKPGCRAFALCRIVPSPQNIPGHAWGRIVSFL